MSKEFKWFIFGVFVGITITGIGANTGLLIPRWL